MERVNSAKKKEVKSTNTSSCTQKAVAPASRNFPLGDIIRLHETVGNAAVQRLYKSGRLQASLKIGQPDDVYEREADRVAEQVTHTPDNCNVSIRTADAPGLQKEENKTTPAAGPKSDKLFNPNLTLQLPQPDFLKLRTPFLERNASGLWDPASALNVWKYNFDFFKRLGLKDDLAGKASNLTAPFAIDSQLKADKPNWWEITDTELKTTSIKLSIPLFEFGADFTGWKPLPFLQKKAAETASGPATPAASQMDVPDAAIPDLGGGQPLESGLRNYFESRFDADFSGLRVHTGTQAAESADSVNARAYTLGNNVVFAAGEYQPGTMQGKRLLAHELTHVVQQRAQKAGHFLQRCPDPASDTAYDGTAVAIKAHAEYGKLDPPTKAAADKIITDAKPKNNCLFYIEKLKLLFDTPVKPPAAIGAQARAETAAANTAEKTRLADPRQLGKKDLEEKASAGRPMIKKPGKFGGGSYFIDASDPNNIMVKAKVLLTKKGGGTDKDVDSIKALEDAIEKAASTRGYLVDIDFVTVADADTFKVDVDTDTWAVATIWAGGDPVTFAHELHHMFAFPLDRYDYTSHASNEGMEIPNRLHWFSEELTKPAGYNDPTSLMSSASHPNDNDVCTVAGLPLAGCLAEREKVNKAFKAIATSYATPEERILNCILKYSAVDAATMMAILRELFRMLIGLPEAKKIVARLKNDKDPLGTVFKRLSAPQQSELLGIIPP